MLSSMFIAGGIDAVTNPETKVQKAKKVAPALAEPLGLPEDTVTLVKINGAVQIGAGVLLALGWFPRVAATALAASLVPTTWAGHRFWEETDKQARAAQRIHFLKNTAMLGGLILAATDLDGRPSLSWRARRAARKASQVLPLNG
jgi:putative oxidoreductase